MDENNHKNWVRNSVAIFLIFVLGAHFGALGNERRAPRMNVLNIDEKDLDLGPFWQVWNTLEDRFAPASSTTPPVSSDDKIYGAIAGLAASYRDPYTVFLPPAESKFFNEEINGSFGGVGMEIGIEGGVLTVVSPLKGTPADKAGVKPGDKIVAINGVLTQGISVDEAVKNIRGEIGTSVEVSFAREGEKELLVKNLVRAVIEIPTVETKVTKEGVFVIELYNFSAVSPNLFRGALREFVLSGSDRLIIDLRNNPGGFLEAAIDMASWFLPTGKVVVTEDFGREGEEDQVYRSKGYDVFNENLKMVILINEGSASASEILAGALREHGKATLIGQKSFGKGSVQELLPITDDTSLKVTVAHWLTPDGNSISNGGITPDVEIELTPENTKDGADPTLDAAVKYLLSK